ncbi:MAG: tetratricopeptide repeat protein [Dongiaceae bacterium]
MRCIVLALAIVVAGCTPSPEVQIEEEFNQRIQSGGLTGAALADAYTDRGILHLATEKPDAAIADFNLAIQAAPEFAEAYVWHGVAMSAKNDKTRAREYFDRALAIDPEFWFAQGMSGLAMAEAGEDDAALAKLARAIDLGMPHRSEYFVRETRYRRYTQVTRRGVAYTTKVPVELAAAASDQLILYHLARAQIFLKRSEKESALAESQQAVQLAPDSSAVRWRLIEVLVALDQCEEANRQAETFGEFAKMLLMARMTDECPTPPKQ